MAEQMPALVANYDDFSDVLYLSLGKPVAAVRTSENQYGFLERRTADGSLVGVTIENFDFAWRDKSDQLAGFLAGLFPIDRVAAKVALTHSA